MPRTSRLKSESGIYHIIMRGINRQRIFFDDEDCNRFIHTLMEYKDVCGFKIYTYCLMENHMHLLLHECKELLGTIMRRICSSYVFGITKNMTGLDICFKIVLKASLWRMIHIF